MEKTISNCWLEWEEHRKNWDTARKRYPPLPELFPYYRMPFKFN